MSLIPAETSSPRPRALAKKVVGTWSDADMGLYLDRCQIDTPDRLVQATWAHVRARREHVDTVIDFGAGDGRFAMHGAYGNYLGYEIDRNRCEGADLPPNARLVHRCAFAGRVASADLCIGNPPFVRNQDLPAGWRAEVAELLRRRSGVAISGLANAWQYFLLLALTSVRDDGLCALVIPYEWASRPSCASLREYIREKGWDVEVYRLGDMAFDSVLTTASITVIDKAGTSGTWRFFEEGADGGYAELGSVSGHAEGHLGYVRPAGTSRQPRAIRGLSPGTQKALTLTEAERARAGLRVGFDVVGCVTSLRHLPHGLTTLDQGAFERHFRRAGARCWLIRTDHPPSNALLAYLDAVPYEVRQTSTCLARDTWWRFKMPDTPGLLIATSFKGNFPKLVTNEAGIRAVGGVAGIHNVDIAAAPQVAAILSSLDIRDRIVSHANGLRKIEINQLNGLLADVTATR